MEMRTMQRNVHNLGLTLAAVSDVLLPLAPGLFHLSTGSANAKRRLEVYQLATEPYTRDVAPSHHFGMHPILRMGLSHAKYALHG